MTELTIFAVVAAPAVLALAAGLLAGIHIERGRRPARRPTPRPHRGQHRHVMPVAHRDTPTVHIGGDR